MIMNKHIIYLIGLLLTVCTSKGYAQTENADCFKPIHRVSAFLGMSTLTNADDNLTGQVTVYGRHKTLFTNITLRYDYFFKRNWGVYVEGFMPGSDGPKPSEWMPLMENNAKGYDYTYTGDADKGNYTCSVITVVADYRLPLNSWEILPSAGMGFSLYDTNNTIDYLRKEKGTNRVEHVETVFKHSHGRYPVLCFVPGVSVLKYVGKRLSIAANMSYVVNLHSMSAEQRRSDAYTHEVLENSSLSVHPGHFLRLGLGVSVQLGKT